MNNSPAPSLPYAGIGYIPSSFSPLEQEGLPQWLQTADPAKRLRLMRIREEGRTLRRELTATISKLQTLYEFCRPQLEKMAGKSYGEVVDTVNGTFLVFKPQSDTLPNDLDEVLLSQRSMYEAALQNFNQAQLLQLARNPYIKLAVPTEFDLFAGFTGKDRNAWSSIISIVCYADEGIAYALRVRSLDMGKQYQEYLTRELAADSLAQVKCVAAMNVLAEELAIADIKGLLSSAANVIVNAFINGAARDDRHGSQIRHTLNDGISPYDYAEEWSLHLLGDVALSEILVFGADKPQSPCVAFVPGHPQQPLKEYPSRSAFLNDLQIQLTSSDFQAFFRRFVPMAKWSSVFDALQEPDEYTRNKRLNLRTESLGKGLKAHWYEQMCRRLGDDARYLAVPTALVEGRTKTFAPIPYFLEATQQHLMFGAGVGFQAEEEDEGQAPSDFVKPWRWVILPNGRYGRWASNLSSYTLPPKLQFDPPNSQGIIHSSLGRAIRINGRSYLIKFDASIGKERLYLDSEARTYNPILEHNGAGSWHHSLERPERWGRLSLLRRLGSWLDDLGDDDLMLAARLSGVTNTTLRRVYSNDDAPPALLVWTIGQLRRVRKTESLLTLVKDGRVVPAEYEVPELAEFRALYTVTETQVPRPRRSPQPDDDNAYCGPDCGTPPAVLFLEWYDRLFRAFLARSETALQLPEPAQVASDVQLGELVQHYPNLPVQMLDELIVQSSPAVLERLARGVLDLNLFERSRRAWNAYRLTRTLMGFRAPVQADINTRTLAFELLPALPGWHSDLNLAMYPGDVRRTTPRRLAQVPGAASWGLGSGGPFSYEVVQLQGERYLESRFHVDFYAALLDLMGPAQRQRLGLGTNETARLRDLLYELAVSQPTRSQALLGIERPRVTLHPHGSERRARAMAGTGGRFERESSIERLQLMFPRASESHIQHILDQVTRQGPTVVDALNRLEDARLRLDGALRAWVGATTVYGTGFAARRRGHIAEQLLNALDPTVTVLEINDAFVDSLPALPLEFDAIQRLTLNLPSMDTLPGSFIARFANLRELHLTARIDSLPNGLTDLPQLHTLSLINAHMRAEDLRPIGLLSQLRELNIINLWPAASPSQTFTWYAEDMAAIARCQHLQRLVLRDCQAWFEGDVIGALTPLQHLTYLDLSGNAFTLYGENVSGLVHLRHLDLSRTPLHDAIDVRRMSELRCLDLHYSYAAWPLGLEGLTHIERANLEDVNLLSVAAGAGRVPGLRLSVHGLNPTDRERLLSELAQVNNLSGAIYGEVRLSRVMMGESTSESEEEVSGGEGDENVLLEGLSTQERSLAQELIDADSNGSRAFFALMNTILSRTPADEREEVTRQAHSIILRMFDETRREEFYRVALDLGCIDSAVQRFSDLLGLAEADRVVATTSGDARPALIELGLSLWRVRSLRESVARRYRDWWAQRPNPDGQPDYAEIELYIRIALTARLRLRHQPRRQANAGMVTWMTRSMADEVETDVLTTQAQDFPVALSDQPFWQEHLVAQECAPWSYEVESALQELAVGEGLPRTLGESARTRLEQLLTQARKVIAERDEVPVSSGPLVLDNEDHRLQAFNLMPALIQLSRVEYTRQVVSEYFAQGVPTQSPQPGPSGVQRKP
ncbi:dermonecrotic toxin domain-containing protein [Pseudomonas sp. NPDC087612]|uniref:dermonecrotic toxin domain-containing protein n=1 Tax=Pseudomonas sp. NPDC087612 TaxID=3364441 RepID=UPI00381C77D1